jgi:hypothetical protein
LLHNWSVLIGPSAHELMEYRSAANGGWWRVNKHVNDFASGVVPDWKQSLIFMQEERYL